MGPTAKADLSDVKQQARGRRHKREFLLHSQAASWPLCENETAVQGQVGRRRSQSYGSKRRGWPGAIKDIQRRGRQRERVKQEAFSWQEDADKCLELYHEILANCGPSDHYMSSSGDGRFEPEERAGMNGQLNLIVGDIGTAKNVAALVSSDTDRSSEIPAEIHAEIASVNSLLDERLELECDAEQNWPKSHEVAAQSVGQESHTSDTGVRTPLDRELAHTLMAHFNYGQTKAFEMALSGRNLLITGGAGTGKSFVLKRIIKYLRSVFDHNEVGVAALTGVAAEHIDGCSLHLLLGIRISISKSKAFASLSRSTICRLKVLVIDEISMVSGEFLDLLDKNFKEIRGSTAPFGGIQMIFCGDFYQLPPIRPPQTLLLTLCKEFNQDLGDIMLHLGMAFESKSWMHGEISFISLPHVVRQSEEVFVQALQDVRLGRRTERLERLWKELKYDRDFSLIENKKVEVTRLLAKKKDVNHYNSTRLQALDESTEVVFEAIDEAFVCPVLEREITNAETALRIARQEGKLHRDSLDKVDRLSRKMEELLSRKRKALKFLKSQRLFLNTNAVDKLVLREGAQVMVLKNMRNFDTKKYSIVNGSRGVIVGFTEHFSCPIVKLISGEEVVIERTDFRVDIANVGGCIRQQIPLCLSWAITVHKSQGQTLDLVSVDVKNFFTEGQLYVALSRARSAKNLLVLSSDSGGPHLFRNAAVDRFYSDMRRNEYVQTKVWNEQLTPVTERLHAAVEKAREMEEAKARKAKEKQILKEERARKREEAKGKREEARMAKAEEKLKLAEEKAQREKKKAAADCNLKKRTSASSIRFHVVDQDDVDVIEHVTRSTSE
eukprot:CAMPEP_0198733428 /NCGR_PEP_ID=MMETSP1475-20131203/45823_1 /TAXON_ID= ORGANISM="Unidentified sp., Strain CCMP1999" /NCGR_SAMPLE_ID=MMETSP1475 /ASSEMBLY_ACC=CAM_ASM_001111 /LENGTH=836 /DNA_ID=CAMNT_0044496731 /DNA_START=155 /DNA_END=2666 /DNA_ORIENTATION=-